MRSQDLLNRYNEILLMFEKFELKPLYKSLDEYKSFYRVLVDFVCLRFNLKTTKYFDESVNSILQSTRFPEEYILFIDEINELEDILQEIWRPFNIHGDTSLWNYLVSLQSPELVSRKFLEFYIEALENGNIPVITEKQDIIQEGEKFFHKRNLNKEPIAGNFTILDMGDFSVFIFHK